MGSHSRRNLRSQVAHVGTLGVAAGSIVLAGTASAQGIEVDGQAYVAIKVATWQLTADGQALVTLSDGSTHNLAAGDFQIIDGQFYALESLVGPDGSGLLGAGLIAAGGAGALVIGALALTTSLSVPPVQAQIALVRPAMFTFCMVNNNQLQAARSWVT